MLLSSLLPPNLPKIQQSSKQSVPGKVRELSSQREPLSVPLVSNNFRRFVTKVGRLPLEGDHILTPGRAVVLGGGSSRRGAVLAEAKMDLGVHDRVDVHL